MTGNLTIILNLPQDILGTLNTSDVALERQLLQLICLELFREGRISTGKGAELLQISKWEFIQLLSQDNVPYFTESAEEINTEVEAVDKLLNLINK